MAQQDMAVASRGARGALSALAMATYAVLLVAVVVLVPLLLCCYAWWLAALAAAWTVYDWKTCSTGGAGARRCVPTVLCCSNKGVASDSRHPSPRVADTCAPGW